MITMAGKHIHPATLKIWTAAMADRSRLFFSNLRHAEQWGNVIKHASQWMNVLWFLRLWCPRLRHRLRTWQEAFGCLYLGRSESSSPSHDASEYPWKCCNLLFILYFLSLQQFYVYFNIKHALKRTEHRPLQGSSFPHIVIYTQNGNRNVAKT